MICYPFSSNVNSMSLSVLMKYINQNPSTSKNVRFYKVCILKHYIEILKSWQFKEGSLLRIWEQWCESLGTWDLIITRPLTSFEILVESVNPWESYLLTSKMKIIILAIWKDIARNHWCNESKGALWLLQHYAWPVGIIHPSWIPGEMVMMLL